MSLSTRVVTPHRELSLLCLRLRGERGGDADAGGAGGGGAGDSDEERDAEGEMRMQFIGGPGTKQPGRGGVFASLAPEVLAARAHMSSCLNVSSAALPLNLLVGHVSRLQRLNDAHQMNDANHGNAPAL